MLVRNRMKAPAIGLIVSGGLLALIALFTILMAFSMPQGNMFMSGDRAAKLMMLRALALLLGIVPLIASGFTIFGGITMLKQKSYAWSKAGSISAIVGGILIGLPGWLLVMPFGIWALVTLNKFKGQSTKFPVPPALDDNVDRDKEAPHSAPSPGHRP